MKKQVQVTLSGCDDATRFVVELSCEEIEFLKRLERISKEKSTYGCMPTLRIEEDSAKFYED